MKHQVDLNRYDNHGYYPGGHLKRVLWYFINAVIFNTFIPFPSVFKTNLLNLFGANVGSAVMIKPLVNIKYPWFLKVGNYCWIGEGVWIDNLSMVIIGEHSVLSQDVYLLTGSHNYKKETFDLIVKKITIENGVWLGAKSVVCGGVKCKSHSVLTAGSIATSDLNSFTVYQGNPAIAKRKRIIS